MRGRRSFSGQGAKGSGHLWLRMRIQCQKIAGAGRAWLQTKEDLLRTLYYSWNLVQSLFRQMLVIRTATICNSREKAGSEHAYLTSPFIRSSLENI